jgi:hypothetical protein
MVQKKWKGSCRNPNLGLATKAKAYKGVGQEWSPRVTFHAPDSAGECEGLNPPTPKWASTLGIIGTPKYSEGDCRGQNSLDWEVPYIIEKFLELRCPKWALVTHLST